jgi:hypothetical protein
MRVPSTRKALDAKVALDASASLSFVSRVFTPCIACVQFKNVQVNSVPILLAQLQPARRFGQGLYTMVQPACSLSFTAAFGWLINILINYWHWWTGDWTENVCQAFFSFSTYMSPDVLEI